MNIEKNLILIKDEDKTKDVEYCKYDRGMRRAIIPEGFNNFQ